MPDFDAQHTDRENAKAPPKSVARDNDVTSMSRGSIQSIANEDYRSQQSDSGKGADPVTAPIKRNVKQ